MLFKWGKTKLLIKPKLEFKMTSFEEKDRLRIRLNYRKFNYRKNREFGLRL